MSLFNIFRCNNDLSRLERRMEILPAMAEKLEKLSNLTKALAALPKLSEKLESFQSLYGKFEELQTKVQAVEEKLAVFQESMDKQLENLGRMGQDSPLEKTIVSLSEEVRDVKQQLDSCMEVITPIPGQERQLSDEINALSKNLAEVGEKISGEVDTACKGISNDLHEKQKQAAEQDERIAKEMTSRLDKLDGLVPQIEEILTRERSHADEAFDHQSRNMKRLISSVEKDGKLLESMAETQEKIAGELEKSQNAEQIIATGNQITAKIEELAAEHSHGIKALQDRQESLTRSIVDLPIDSILQNIEQLREEQEKQKETYTPLLQKLDERLVGIITGIDEKVSKEVNRLGKTIFKLTNSVESARGNFEQAIADFEKEKNHYQQEHERLKEKSKEETRNRELQLAQDLFLLMDALDSGIETGKDLLNMGTVRQRFGIFSKTVAGVPKEAVDSWLTGMKMMQRRTLNILKSVEVEPIEALEQAFDPNIHKAIDVEKGPTDMVVKEITRGYRSGERVLRYAEVIVGKQD